jgi:hypothetical protein
VAFTHPGLRARRSRRERDVETRGSGRSAREQIEVAAAQRWIVTMFLRAPDVQARARSGREQEADSGRRARIRALANKVGPA